ncbi:MAG TPA: dihydroorotase family protein [Candidatus Limnocylindrales bacterium]|nr:dihydroorotase family protein [Candidatus Limnocylindrales bacterium]
MLKLPGLIDPHVHLRTPGQSHKEDFYTGTSAALAGGYTTIIDMPNNQIPITTLAAFEEKKEIAKKEIVCDVGFHFGSLGEKFEEFANVYKNVFGLKIYLNQTTGNYFVDEKVFEKICKGWPSTITDCKADQFQKPILVHAEEDVLESIIQIAHDTEQKLHVCHVSSEKELRIIMKAKEKRFKITCGVTPHHLFLTVEDEKKLGSFGKMKPSLKSKIDQDFLWNNLSYIDIVESDHAPHTLEEKQLSNVPFGVPGLETTLPLLLTAVHDKKLTINDIRRLCHDDAAEIFNIKTDPQTFIEIDENEEYVIKNENLFTKCKWSPFHGWKVKGKVKSVTIRGTKVFEDGKIIINPGFGKILS